MGCTSEGDAMKLLTFLTNPAVIRKSSRGRQTG
jgi:hypothetical protein